MHTIEDQRNTPLDHQKIIKISQPTAEALIAHIDEHNNSLYEVIEVDGQYYNVTEAKTEDIVAFLMKRPRQLSQRLGEEREAATDSSSTLLSAPKEDQEER